MLEKPSVCLSFYTTTHSHKSIEFQKNTSTQNKIYTLTKQENIPKKAQKAYKLLTKSL